MKSGFGGALIAAMLAAGCASVAAQNEGEAADSYANFLVGRLANLRDDHQAASDRLYRALIANPGDATLIDGVLAAALATGDSERARTVARLRVTHGDTPTYAQIVRGADDIAGGRFRQAREEVSNTHGDPATQLMARLLLVWAKTGEGRVDEVAAELGRMGNMRPYGGLFAFQQAMMLDVSGRGAEALAAYETAELGGLYLPPATERHADLLVRTGARDHALALLRSSNGRMINPQLAAAAARLDAHQGVSADPLNAARGAAIGLYGLAAIFEQEGDSAHALAALTIATMLDPSLDAARISFAEVQSSLHHPDAARAALEEIPTDSPYAESAKVMQAWALAADHQDEAAIALARQTAENGGPRARRALADIYRSLDRHAEAEPLYTALIEAQPPGAQDWRLYYARGAAREALNRWPEAEADMRQALRLSPEQPEVLNYLGYSWVDRGEHLQEGLAMIQRAAALRPMSGAIIDSLGWAYFKMGRYDLAVENLEHAVELSPADAVLNDHLGDAYWRAERRTEARFQWRRALALDPTPTTRTALETKLARGLPASRSANR